MATRCVDAGNVALQAEQAWLGEDFFESDASGHELFGRLGVRQWAARASSRGCTSAGDASEESTILVGRGTNVSKRIAMRADAPDPNASGKLAYNDMMLRSPMRTST